MAYVKTVYGNDNPPAINAANLNKMEQGIYDAHQGNSDLMSAIYVNNAVLHDTLYGTEILFDQSEITDNYFVNATTGVLLSDPESKLSASGYVPVFGLKKVGIPNGVGQFAYYNANKVYLSGEQLPSVAHQYAEYTIPDGAAYARFTLYKSLKTTVYYKFPIANNDYTKGVVRYDFDTLLNETYKSIARENIDAASSNTVTNSLNIELNNKMAVNTGTLTSGKYVNAGTGALLDGSSTASDYLHVIPGLKVGISRGIGQFAFYDINKTYISGVAVALTIHDYEEYNIPAKAYYVRFTLSNSFTQSKMYYVISNGESNPLKPFAIVGTDDLKMPDFKRIRDAVSFAKKWSESKVFIQNGTYDLITEFATEISQSPVTQIGVALSNGIHVIGESGSEITGNYEGSDANVVTNFSPFYSEKADGGFTLENITIKAKNCRYCVHDEYSSGSYISINKYINCNMYMDFTNPPSGFSASYNQCIGGGLAQHSYIFISGCYFKTKAAETATKLAVSYHNAYTAGSKSRIVVEDSYFADHSTIRFGFYGLSTLLSEAIVSNCSLGAEPFTRKEDPSQETPDNFTLTKWNNEIRI